MRSNSRRRSNRRSNRRKQRGAGIQLKIQYDQQTVAGQEFTAQETAVKPVAVIPEGYYLVLYDPDAVKPAYIHWISSTTQEFMPYQEPTPPPGTGIHRYIFVLCKGTPPSVPGKRNSQNPATVIQNPVATVFFTVNSDPAVATTV